jgi:acyl-[acyl-carrier-protein]-phospholipid O-acyltransferase/long-chain-fatty-acid--[acyl-carrier-protein] ligase
LLLPASVLLALNGCRRRRPQDVATILFSGAGGGHAGQPVAITHRNLVANVAQIVDVLNTECDDVVLASLPLSHAFGLTVTLCMPLLAGVRMACQRDPCDALGSARAVARSRVTLLFGTSTQFGRWLEQNRIHPAMLDSLRLLIAGTERLDPAVRDRFALRFDRRILESYGATETSPLASLNVPDAIETQHWKVQIGSKPGSVGMPLPGNCFRIVDPGTLEPLPAGRKGLVLIGGVQIMSGYLDDPQRSADAIVEQDGIRWFKSGDVGFLDEDGFLTITQPRGSSAPPVQGGTAQRGAGSLSPS